ncbi:hypothetical protein HDF24_15015 [Mucilaginibacter sp. X4EP1]|uniref:hypothetical protein n=1 Tax=Mucilaginibacter sp. X4EP1 TaxID=2723092 RepID=UPI002166D49F|nr:hypothetical protein [Mucilaginibacter sp. X4EP1]MCS3815394.1 hypothetical protein [Mucilaginibacter sp. X4EP1]
MVVKQSGRPAGGADRGGQWEWLLGLCWVWGLCYINALRFLLVTTPTGAKDKMMTKLGGRPAAGADRGGHLGI